MPLITCIEATTELRIALWHCTEEPSLLLGSMALSPADTLRYQEIRNVSRQRQWLGCRAALGILLNSSQVFLDHTPEGKPSLIQSSAFISFSHTNTYSAALLSNHTPAGIDLEEIRPRIQRIIPRFLSQNEQALLSADDLITGATFCWTAKEAVYKQLESPQPDIISDLIIESIDYLCGTWQKAAVLVKPPNRVPVRITVTGFRLGNLLISWTSPHESPTQS